MPMVVDEGPRGLEQSQHHPNAGLGAYASTHRDNNAESPPQRPIEDEIKLLTIQITSRVKEDEIEFVKDRLEKLCECAHALGRSRVDASPTTHDSNNNAAIRKAIEEILPSALSKALGTIPVNPNEKKSWANVAASTSPHQSSAASRWQPKAVVPARRQREVIIRAPGAAEALTKRSPQQVVSAVNTARNCADAVAARRLPSGDVILTFKEAVGTEDNTDSWVKTAFGPTAILHRREVAVIVKGLPAQRLRTADDTELLKALQKDNTIHITRCKKILPKNRDLKYATATLHVSNVDAAKRLCSDGLIWEAQIFDCEPFCADLRTQQCFKCYQFGHVARYCQKTARCGHCAAAAHVEGERSCPEVAPSGRKRCVNCKGSHTAWDRRCPAARAQRDRIKEAYQHRPMQFEEASISSRSDLTFKPPTSVTTTPRTRSDSDGFQVVQPRLKRARVISGPRGRGSSRGPPRGDLSRSLERYLRSEPQRDSNDEAAATVDLTSSQL